MCTREPLVHAVLRILLALAPLSASAAKLPCKSDDNCQYNWKGNDPISFVKAHCGTCVQRFCSEYCSYTYDKTYDESCMSGNTGTFRVSSTEDGTYGFERTVTVVKELKTGDKIEGLDADKQPALCTVEAIGQFGQGALYGNYTVDHFVLDPTTGNLKQHGAVGNLTFEDRYDVMTSCPVGIDEAGTGFTPLDGGFCGKSTSEMNWSDYLLIHKSMLQIVRATGGYWFSASAYKDFGSVVQHGPELCAAMLACAGAGTECDDLEKLATLFIDNYVTDDAREASLKGMPGLGKVGAPGSVSFVVSQGKACSTEHIVLITAGTVAVVAMLLVVGVVATVHHRRRKQSTPAAIELEPSNRKLDPAAPEVAVV